jgi:cytochrome o ubiquinol oxidase subunit 2
MRRDKLRRARRIRQAIIASLIGLAIVGILFAVTAGREIPVLDTKGMIADKERDLIYITFALGMFVVIPVFVMLFSIAWKYRATNKRAKYEPETDGNTKLEALWWGIPILIIFVLAIITAISTHALDPYKKLESNVQPVKIQVISLNWKWLFIYPDQEIATVNYVNIPKDTPIDFELTSDAPMNSFWIPALAGQVYSMAGMTTQLHLMADSTGTFNGSSSNISGDGYADMTFKVNALSETNFKTWAAERYSSNAIPLLTQSSYEELVKPSHKNPEKTYLLSDTNLYNKVVMKYMSPEGSK